MRATLCAIDAPSTGSPSRARIWTGRILSTLLILFLLFNASMKLIGEPHVVQASSELGYSAGTLVPIGLILLFCTILYMIPRFSFFGAVLLTGYLGGAVATHVRAANPPFEQVFPVLFGILLWTSLLLRQPHPRPMLRLFFCHRASTQTTGSV